MLIRSNQEGIIVRYRNPNIALRFDKEPIEVTKEQAEVLLKNPNFKEVKKGDKDV